MKRAFTIFAILLAFAFSRGTASAGDGDFFQIGVKASLNFTNMKGLKDFDQGGFLKTYTGFNAGVAFRFNLPLGFELQPELLYVQSGSRMDAPGWRSFDYKVGSLRVPVNVQWGFRFLKIIKPYIVFSPYVGYNMFSKLTYTGDAGSVSFKGTDSVEPFQYGVGIGAGINVWKFQLSFKWNWELSEGFRTIDKETAKFNGGELSLAFLF